MTLRLHARGPIQGARFWTSLPSRRNRGAHASEFANGCLNMTMEDAPPAGGTASPPAENKIINRPNITKS